MSQNMTVQFLMPCHSTPWRSHLIHTGIHARALSCEPPLGLVGAARESYRDEADVFYDDPEAWLRGNLQKEEEKPRYVVFFEQLEETMKEWRGLDYKGFGYDEVWRGFNTHWHDDWRRVGDVIVWKRHG